MVRQAAFAIYLSTGNYDTAAQALRISPRSVRRWVQQRNKGGSLANSARSGRPKRLSKGQEAALVDIIHQQAHGSVRRAAAQLAATEGTHISAATAWRALRNAGQVFGLSGEFLC